MVDCSSPAALHASSHLSPDPRCYSQLAAKQCKRFACLAFLDEADRGIEDEQRADDCSLSAFAEKHLNDDGGLKHGRRREMRPVQKVVPIAQRFGAIVLWMPRSSTSQLAGDTRVRDCEIQSLCPSEPPTARLGEVG